MQDTSNFFRHLKFWDMQKARSLHLFYRRSRQAFFNEPLMANLGVCTTGNGLETVPSAAVSDCTPMWWIQLRSRWVIYTLTATSFQTTISGLTSETLRTPLFLCWNVNFHYRTFSAVPCFGIQPRWSWTTATRISSALVVSAGPHPFFHPSSKFIPFLPTKRLKKALSDAVSTTGADFDLSAPWIAVGTLIAAYL